MENRYFLLKDSQTLEVYVSLPMAEQPENSLPFQTHEFKRACFNQFPNPTALVEGITDAEIIAKYTQRIQNAFTHLRRRALASSINKQGDWDYIFEQSEQYKLKYRVAKGEITNTAVQQLIADEANDFNITVPEMNALIISMFEAGEDAYNKFTAMIERGRTKALTMLEIGAFNRALEIIELMENVPEQLTMEQAQTLTAQMIAI